VVTKFPNDLLERLKPVLVKIYTRTGDGGSTGLFGGPRVTKDDCRIEAYGTVDELSAVLGLVRSTEITPEMDRAIERIQHELFSIGAELATPEPDRFDLRVIGPRHIATLESWIDAAEQGLPPLKTFILPGGTKACAHLHLARSVCRRAERRLVTLQQACERAVERAEDSASLVSQDLGIYLNRLSDLLFVLARKSNHDSGLPDVPWVKPAVSEMTSPGSDD